MRKTAFLFGCAVACLGIVGTATAQEGHPLSGTWSGDWGPSLDDRRHVTLVMDYDGERVVGVMNPGPNSVPLDAVRLDVTDWTVEIAATGQGDAGAVEITADGRIENLESYHRTISGTWRQGGVEGDFRIERD